MKIELLKAWTPHSRKLPKGTQMGVTNDKGRELIEKGIAVEINGNTREEIATIDKLIEEAENDLIEETDEQKKVTKKKNNQK